MRGAILFWKKNVMGLLKSLKIINKPYSHVASIIERAYLIVAQYEEDCIAFAFTRHYDKNLANLKW